MISSMVNIYFPLCSLIINIIVSIMFFSKEKIKNKDTEIYGKLLKVGLIESIVMFITNLLVALIFYKVDNLYFEILNKLLYCIYIIWMSLMFTYIYEIQNKKQDLKRDKIVNYASYILNSILFILIFALPIELLYENGLTNSYGKASDILYLGCSIYLSLTIIMTAVGFSKVEEKRKYYPLFVLIVLMSIMMVIRNVDPLFNFSSNNFSIVLLIMFFTIENPDIKMIEMLELARDTAEKANRAKSDFLSSMSHEIRTPLNAIVGLSEDIASYKDKVPKEVIEDTEDIRNASLTLLEIVGNILDINKIESNKLEIMQGPYNFREEIVKMARVTSNRIGDKPIKFNINISEDVPYELIGDKVHVKEVVNNLLSNAFKYTDKGEVNLNVKCINQNNNCLLIISVEDTGRGIKAEYINKLFTKFERLDIEKDTTTEGTGLGLAITKRLVEMMNGKINVQSQFGKGSIFVVQLPQKISKLECSIEKIIEKQEIIEKSIVKNNLKRKVLIVDDNSLNLKVARRALGEEEYDIEEVDNGKDCINLIESGKKYDFILLDIMMPKMGGEETLKILKQNKDFDIPVIALTADAVSGAEEKYKKMGFVDYLAKPFSREQLKEKINKLFRY